MPAEDVTLTAANGTWSGSPTSYAYQWRRCATDGTRCGDITGATKQTYLLVSGDVSRTVGVAVTAANADGKTTASLAADGRRRLEERLGEHRQAGGHRLGHGWRRAQGVESACGARRRRRTAASGSAVTRSANAA